MSRNIGEFYIANRKHRTDGNLFVVLAFFVDKTFFLFIPCLPLA
nr:MAG TPA: hypothetical protein [Caudoviricetes sp.]